MGNLGDYTPKELLSKPLDPVALEINRLENRLRDKERELGAVHSEIKALKVTEVLKDKAITELSDELDKMDEKLHSAGKLLEYKNIEIKKLLDSKREAMAAQFSAEATLRRVYATQKDEEFISIDAIIAPLESDIKMCRNQIATLQEDKKALERITKSKEAALIEAEKILHSALERALIVEKVQNQNFDLKKQIEIYQEENKLLEKVNRQKVVEIEKLTQIIRELEESILASGEAANIVRDYRRQLSESNEEKKILERELARVKVLANRVATVVANEWKDENDKVMPVKQWLDERRLLQGEMQRLRDKLSVSERTAKAEAQLKDRLKLRLKTLEEGLKHGSSISTKRDETTRVFGLLTCNNGSKMRSSSQANKQFSSQQLNTESGGFGSCKNMKHTSSLKTKFIDEEKLIRKNLWAPRSKIVDENMEQNAVGIEHVDDSTRRVQVSREHNTDECHNDESQDRSNVEDSHEDVVSGFLYDKLQKEVINLRKLHEEKDGLLGAKDDEIKLLLKKVDTLTKAMEIELKKSRREAVAREKEAIIKSEDHKPNRKTTHVSKRAMKHHGDAINSRT